MKIKRFQQGGPISPEEQAMAEQQAQGGAPQGGPSPEEQLAGMAQQIIEQVGPEAAAALAQIIMQMLQGGGGAPQGAPEGQPVMQRRGGRLVMLGRR